MYPCLGEVSVSAQNRAPTQSVKLHVEAAHVFHKTDFEARCPWHDLMMLGKGKFFGAPVFLKHKAKTKPLKRLHTETLKPRTRKP